MSRNFDLLQQTNGEQYLFRAPGTPALPVSTPGPVRVPARGEESQHRLWKSRLPRLRWLELIEKARSWRWPEQARNGHRRGDLEAITREEEIKLVQRVFLPAGLRSPQAVVFSGVEGEAGCTSICARTSVILAGQADGPVCVVDASLRSPSLHQYFDVENSKGLAQAMVESGPVQEFAHQLAEGDLWVMPSGFAAAQLKAPLVSARLQSRMTELRRVFRHVVILSSPLGLDTEPIQLSRWTDGVVLVVEANSTRRESARRVKEALEVAGVRVLGVVLNNRTFPIPDALYRRL